MSKKLSIASAVMTVVAAAMSLLLLSITPALAHHSANHAQGGGNESTEQSKGTEDTKGNDRKSGYENNSKTPQEPNHGKGSDRDGDADSDPATAHEDGHTSTNDQPNAHPSGRDKDGEAGRSGNQGKAESNPDDSKGPMRFETEKGQGDDKPGGPGGTDRDDQDGNNGCGNDDDFDDDNNGWCGKPVKETAKVEKPDEVEGGQITRPCDKDDNMANGIQPCEKDEEILPELEKNPVLPEDEVLGELIERDENPARPEGPSVLGIRLSPALAQPVAVAGAVLPFTGGEALIFLIAAFALILGGAAVLMFRRSEA